MSRTKAGSPWVYCDNDVSAYRGKRRHNYLMMLDDIKNGLVDAFVVWHVDRLHRNDREVLDFIDVVQLTGVEVATVTSGDRDLSTADGQMMAKIESALAVRESKHKGSA